MSDVEHAEPARPAAILAHSLGLAKHRASLQRTIHADPHDEAPNRAAARSILDRFTVNLLRAGYEQIFPLHDGSDGFRVDLVTKLEVSIGAAQELRVSGPAKLMASVIADLDDLGVDWRRPAPAAVDHVG
jgi:hypothetical protein